MRILYIEDNATNVILVQRVANMGKHEVMNYDDGQEALDHFEQYKPDLILLDVQLRGALTGLDVAHALRTKGCTSPIIAVTAYAMKGDRQRCLDAGCDDYLPKPISVAELVTVFKRYGDAVAAGKPIVSTFEVTSGPPGATVDAAVPKPIVLTPASTVEGPLEPTALTVETSHPTSSASSEPVVAPSPLPEITSVESSVIPPKSLSEIPPVDTSLTSEKAINPPAVEPVVERTPAPMNAEP